MLTVKLKPKSECTFDQISLGEVMLRLDPGQGRIKTTRSFDATIHDPPTATTEANAK